MENKTDAPMMIYPVNSPLREVIAGSDPAAAARAKVLWDEAPALPVEGFVQIIGSPVKADTGGESA